MRNQEIGARIRERRTALGISAVEIAQRTGMSKATIHRYESGDIKHIKLPVIEVIADTLRVNPAWLIGKSESMDAVRSEDVVELLDLAISNVRNVPLLVANGRVVSEDERNMLLSALHMIKNIVDRG